MNKLIFAVGVAALTLAGGCASRDHAQYRRDRNHDRYERGGYPAGRPPGYETGPRYENIPVQPEYRREPDYRR